VHIGKCVTGEYIKKPEGFSAIVRSKMLRTFRDEHGVASCNASNFTINFHVTSTANEVIDFCGIMRMASFRRIGAHGNLGNAGC
jgi:hypothetical protein